MSKFKISRQGKKLQVSDDPRVLLALPKDVQERTWSEILAKEENEIVCFEIREEIIDGALAIGYEKYMEKQTIAFSVYCSALAWLKLIDWQFFRHDPGEDASAKPLCYIPKRLESWTPDELPEPCVKDSWSRQMLRVLDECPEDKHLALAENESLEMKVVPPIPRMYWFPGNINLITDYVGKDGVKRRHIMEEDPSHHRPNVELVGGNCHWHFVEVKPSTVSEEPSKIDEIAESEVLQKITDYVGVGEEVTSLVSHHSSLKLTSPVDGSLQGAGDSSLEEQRQEEKPRRRISRINKIKSKSTNAGFKLGSLYRSQLPPIMADSLSAVSLLSDCHLRNLRLDVQYEVEEEIVVSPWKGAKNDKK